MPVASNPVIKLSLFEKVDLFAKIPLILIALILKIAWTHPRRYLSGWPLGRTFATSLIHVAYRFYSTRQRLSMLPPTGDAVRTYSSKHKLKLKTWEFECEGATPSAALHELDVTPSSEAKAKPDRILIWFHGGGYAVPCSGDLLLPIVLKYAETFGASKVFILEYTLAPGLKYPGQMVQAVGAMNYLLKQKHYDPSQILLGGDSAGGHLALSLLAHVIQPSHYAKPLEGLGPSEGKKLKGLLVLSPIVTVPLDAASYPKYDGIDVISLPMMEDVFKKWLPRNEIWADFLLTSPGFWDNLPVGDILMTAGAWESFSDDIIRLGDIMGLEKRKDARRRLRVGENEIHDQPTIDCFGGIPFTGSDINLDIMEWLKRIAS